MDSDFHKEVVHFICELADAPQMLCPVHRFYVSNIYINRYMCLRLQYLVVWPILGCTLGSSLTPMWHLASLHLRIALPELRIKILLHCFLSLQCFSNFVWQQAYRNSCLWQWILFQWWLAACSCWNYTIWDSGSSSRYWCHTRA